ncbi:MAG: DUF5666 domain-containing protein [Pseudomonadota bacterium]|nr:DUF5666 domain-containing protein [Pseudomonadota bacterium]
MTRFPVAQTGGPARRWLQVLGLSLLTALAVNACGGGGDVAGVGSGGTGSFSVGTITGFGSVFVNGQRYDDSGASVSDENGPRSRADLRLGMVVTVQASVSASGSATASSITFDSELLGPVDTGSVNAGGKSFAILGQKVLVAAGTVFDPQLPLGLSSIREGQTLEVHGYVNPLANELQATFVAPASGAARYKISGAVSALLIGARTFRIGTATVSYAGLDGSGLPQGLADGVLVKVRLAPGGPTAAGARQATALRLNDAIVSDQPSAEVEGLITSFTSASQFNVGTISVDARNANFAGATTGLGLGARVAVKGAVSAGTLVAREVKLEDPKAGVQIELEGAVAALDKAAKTFVLRGVTVSYAGAVQYKKGGQADLRDGAKVEVKGQISPNGAVVNASRIEFDD